MEFVLKKHTLWTDILALIAPDPEHSLTEEREWIIGQFYKNRLLIVVYTIRDDKIRIINARLATKSEKKQYEQEY